MHRDPDRSWITDSNSDHPKGTHRTKAGKLPRSRHCQPNENQRLQSVMRTLSLAKMKRRSIWRKHKRQKNTSKKRTSNSIDSSDEGITPAGNKKAKRKNQCSISAYLIPYSFEPLINQFFNNVLTKNFVLKRVRLAKSQFYQKPRARKIITNRRKIKESITKMPSINS